MSHFNFEDRKKISNGISNGLSCVEIGLTLDKDPTSVSKEVKRNRVISKEPKIKNRIMCKKLDRWPYVCVDCKHKYRDCPFVQFTYNATIAQKNADSKLHESRRGINLTKEEHAILNECLLKGKIDKVSVYDSILRSGVDISVSTAYRYINNGIMSIKHYDLPYALKYKKRKVQNKKYEYYTKLDRSNRTFLDYLSYMHTRINEKTVQMDFLGSIKTDYKSILVLVIPQLKFPMLFLITNPTAEKVTKTFDMLEERLGIELFKMIFPSILTDRDPCFGDYIGIEFNKETGEQRTYIFYCDAFKSNQKANVENINKQLRKYFPKGHSIDKYDETYIRKINLMMLETKIRSLDGHSPREAFELIFGKEAFKKLFNL